MSATEGAFNVPLKCTPEEQKHFADPALAEANKSNFPAALDIVTNGLNAHPASEGLLFLKAYFGYKLAEAMSHELASLPRAIESIGEGVLMIDGAATTGLLGRFGEIVRVLGESGAAIDELLQVNPKSQDVLAFKSYIERKLQKLGQESENMRETFTNSHNVAGGFCVGCRQGINFDSQKVVFRRSPANQMEVWHLPCFQKAGQKH